MIALALVYAGLVALFLAAIAGDRLGLIPRTVMIVVVPALAFAVWQTSRPPAGWPTSSTPHGTLVAGVVREPEPGDPGEIDLWLIPPGAVRPRAYRQPYTRRLHRQLVAAMRAVQHGGRIGVAKRNGAVVSKARFVFYKEPPAALPAKPAS